MYFVVANLKQRSLGTTQLQHNQTTFIIAGLLQFYTTITVLFTKPSLSYAVF